MSQPLRIRLTRSRCPFCHEQVEATEAKTGCEGCTAWHHLECWESHGRCSACGHERTEPEPWCAWPGGCASPANEVIYEILDAHFCAAHGKREVKKTVRFALPYGIVTTLSAAACTCAALVLDTLSIPLLVASLAFWILGLGLTASSMSGYFRVHCRL